MKSVNEQEFDELFAQLQESVEKLAAMHSEKERRLSSYPPLIRLQILMRELKSSPTQEILDTSLHESLFKFKIDLTNELLALFSTEDSQISDWQEQFEFKAYDNAFFWEYEAAPKAVATTLIVAVIAIPFVLAALINPLCLLTLPIFVAIACGIHYACTTYITNDYSEKSKQVLEKVTVNNYKVDCSRSADNFKQRLKETNGARQRFFNSAHNKPEDAPLPNYQAPPKHH